MAEQATTYPVTFMCRLLRVNRATYYRWRHQQIAPPPPRVARHRQSAARVQALFTEANGRVGRRPMCQLLAQDGIACAPGTVHRIMAEQGLVAQRRRAGKRTTRRDPAAHTAHITNRWGSAGARRC